MKSQQQQHHLAEVLLTQHSLLPPKASLTAAPSTAKKGAPRHVGVMSMGFVRHKHCPETCTDPCGCLQGDAAQLSWSQALRDCPS